MCPEVSLQQFEAAIVKLNCRRYVPATRASLLITSNSPCRKLLGDLGGASWLCSTTRVISGAKGRDRRPGLDALLRGVA
jgi:hypothetical protein